MQRELSPRFDRSIVEIAEHDTGIYHCNTRRAVDGADAVQAAEGQHNAGLVLPVAFGDGAETQSGIAAQWKDRLAFSSAERDDGGDLLRRGRLDNGERSAATALAPIGDPRLHLRRIGDQPLVADDAAKLCEHDPGLLRRG